MERAVVVVALESGTWVVRALDSTWEFDNRANAETFARLYGSLYGPCLVRIEPGDGTVEEYSVDSAPEAGTSADGNLRDEYSGSRDPR